MTGRALLLGLPRPTHRAPMERRVPWKAPAACQRGPAPRSPPALAAGRERGEQEVMVWREEGNKKRLHF